MHPREGLGHVAGGDAGRDRRTAAEHEMKHRRRREDVGSLVRAAALQLLRRRVRRRSIRQRQAEVDQLHDAARLHQHVAGLQVPVDDAKVVRRPKTVAHLKHEGGLRVERLTLRTLQVFWAA